MRDKKRIEPFLERLRVLWEQNPDLRFTQLIMNLPELSFFTEDDKTLKVIEEQIKTMKSVNGKKWD